MHISVSVRASQVDLETEFIPMDVFPEMTLNDIKAIVEDDLRVSPKWQHYFYNSQPIADPTKTLSELNIVEGDILELDIFDPQEAERRIRAQQGISTQERAAQRPRQGPDPEQLRLQMLGDAGVMHSVRSNAPELAAAASDSQTFRRAWDERQQNLETARQEKQAQLSRLNENPFDEDAQKQIEEMIRQERVQENVQKALEDNPESFARVNMLYIDVLVNNVPIKAFVDSGAQTTIMSPDAAERCGIKRLIDTRFGGIARGVGTAVILGRVHSAEIQIGQYNLASSFTVMEGKDVDLLLGLDMLKRHQMCIDLRQNCLIVQDEKIQFLAESEIPKMMDEVLDNEPKVEGPAGTKVGARTGTVEQFDNGRSSTISAPAPASKISSSRINIHPAGSAGNINTKPTTSTSGPSAPAQQPAQQPQPPSQSAFGQPQPITEDSIRLITEMGFSREQALQALNQVGGNVELAIGLLF